MEIEQATIKSVYRAALASGITAIAMGPVMAQSPVGEVEEIFVLGERRAYQGNFDDLEDPTTSQMLDLESVSYTHLTLPTIYPV